MDKPLVWKNAEIKSPPFSAEARQEAGYLLRRIQQGEALAMPQSAPLSRIAAKCHELRIRDRDRTWRIVYYLDSYAVGILDVFSKQTASTPNEVIENCRRRLREYLELKGSGAGR